MKATNKMDIKKFKNAAVRNIARELAGKTISKTAKRVILFAMAFLGTLLAFTSPEIYEGNKILQYVDGAYQYGGFALMATAVLMVAIGIVLFAIMMTAAIDILHKACLSVAFMNRNAKKAKTKALLGKKVYKHKKEDVEFEAFKTKFGPIQPVIQEIVAKYE